MIPALVGKSDYEATHNERIFWTPSWIGYIQLWILEDDIKAAGNASLVEGEDVEEVLQVELEEDEVSVLVWECVLSVSSGALVKTN